MYLVTTLLLRSSTSFLFVFHTEFVYLFYNINKSKVNKKIKSELILKINLLLYPLIDFSNVNFLLNT